MLSLKIEHTPIKELCYNLGNIHKIERHFSFLTISLLVTFLHPQTFHSSDELLKRTIEVISVVFCFVAEEFITDKAGKIKDLPILWRSMRFFLILETS